jgi:hypothetical protein
MTLFVRLRLCISTNNFAHRKEKNIGVLSSLMAICLNRPDLKPCCLNHAAPMAADADQQASSPQSGGSVQSYICQSAGCDLNWERHLGYFRTTTVQRTFQFGIGGKRCPTPDHLFLFVSRFSTAGRIWRCPADGCPHTETEP